MDDNNWLDRQLKEARQAVNSWSERKRAVLKAQISGRSRTSTSGEWRNGVVCDRCLDEPPDVA